MIGSEKRFRQLIRVQTVYDLVSYSGFRTSTVAHNKGFMRLFAMASYLMIEKKCSSAYLTSDLDS